MIGDSLKLFLQKFPEAFKIMKNRQISYLLKELIIMEIICMNGIFISSKDIQKSFEQILLEDNNFPVEYQKNSVSATNKTTLRVMLNNILSSNINNGNGLSTRKEIQIEKRDKNYYFSVSDEFLSDFNELIHSESPKVLSMSLFLEKYKYLTILINLLKMNYKKCEFEVNHSNKKAIIPVFKNNLTEITPHIANIIFICPICAGYFIENEISNLIERKY